MNNWTAIRYKHTVGGTRYPLQRNNDETSTQFHTRIGFRQLKLIANSENLNVDGLFGISETNRRRNKQDTAPKQKEANWKIVVLFLFKRLDPGEIFSLLYIVMLAAVTIF